MEILHNQATNFSMLYKITSRLSLMFVALLLVSGSLFAEGDPKVGKDLFRNNCATCHNKDMKSDLTGPALGGFQERWADYPKEDLYSWIRNSQSMIAAGHPRATELWNQWKPTVMNNVALSNEEIDHVFAYINGVADGSFGPPVVVTTRGEGGTNAPKDNTWLYISIAGVLALLSLILARIISNLDYLTKMKAGDATATRTTLADILTGGTVKSLVLFAALLLGGYYTVNKAINFGRQTDYQPTQPIKFSHATHAGLQQIDCQYCHDGARRSKHSVIPAANTCMNCHKAVKVGSKYGTAEISKIYASIGFDPNTDKYMDNPSNEDIEKSLKKWIADNAVKENPAADAEAIVAEQVSAIKASLTGGEDNTLYGPIEWVRINNLPDHVYFNHSQHVTVGKVECQTCHGAVEEMEVVSQAKPLSMGWCINCHRQTEVKFADNEYYDNYYEKYHKEIKEGSRDKVTVEDIGGLGCQKCHY